MNKYFKHPFILISFIFIYFLVGCASEKGLLKELKIDPDNPETIGDLAKLYYSHKQYNKAYAQYKKLDELKSITEKQQYIKYICGTMIPSVSEKSWEKLYKFRNTSLVKYKYEHDSRGVVFSMPGHWIPLSSKSRPEKEIIEQLDFSYKYKIPSRAMITPGKISRSRNKGYIYGGPGFIMDYNISFIKQSEYSPGEVITIYHFQGLDTQFENIGQSLTAKEDAGEIKNLGFYCFKKLKKMVKFKYTPRVIIHDFEKNIGYVTWITEKYMDQDITPNLYARASKKIRRKRSKEKKMDDITSSKSDSEEKEAIRFLIIIIVGPNGEYIFNMYTHFKNEYSNVYIKEIDRFLTKIDALEDILPPR